MRVTLDAVFTRWHGYVSENRLIFPYTPTEGADMNVDYKGYCIVAGVDHDDTTGLWNGRYRILSDKGIVVYESFVEPVSDQDQAGEAASVAARAWIDRQ